VSSRRRDPGGGPLNVEETIAALDRGEIRVAEKVGDEWVVNEEAKAAILDYFRLRQMEPIEE
jgi:2,3,4,5-tetrahydropyridine-2-carboxylate N-succinyltransferase